MVNKKRYLLVALSLVLLVVFTGCTGGKATEVVPKPIAGFTGILDILVWPMSSLMWVLGKTIAFQNYGLIILFATVIVRSAAWPIYAKTNDMSLKMSIAQPEIAKLEEKYRGKDDPESRNRKGMEQMQLYKKYGIGIGGCLMPFLQFPIFMAFYQTIQRVPDTTLANVLQKYEGQEKFFYKFEEFNHNFLGIDLYQNVTLVEETGKWDWSSLQTWGIVVLAVLVGMTQVAMQILTSRRQKKAKEDSMGNLPNYRRPEQTGQQKQTELTMKIMMYAMMGMMVLFVIRSAAALGFYWLVGNIYSTLQSYISHKTSSKRIEKLKKKY